MPKNLAEQLAGLTQAERGEIIGALPKEARQAINPQVYEASVARGKKLAEPGVPAEMWVILLYSLWTGSIGTQ